MAGGLSGEGGWEEVEGQRVGGKVGDWGEMDGERWCSGEEEEEERGGAWKERGWWREVRELERGWEVEGRGDEPYRDGGV